LGLIKKHTFANNHPINPPASQTSVVLCVLWEFIDPKYLNEPDLIPPTITKGQPPGTPKKSAKKK